MNTKFAESLRNKKVAVIGLGKTGCSVANLLDKLGAKVFVSEKKKEPGSISGLNRGIECEFGSHSERILESELVIKSPGVPDDLDIFAKLRKKQVPIWSELELSYRLIDKPKKIVAITGTNGKTTTSTLINDIFLAAGFKTALAGNIGQPLSSYADEINNNTYIVLEVSSYQLEDIVEFNPDICGVLNITPDHLEHHKTMEQYIKSKQRVFMNQTMKDYCIINHDDKICRRIAENCKSNVMSFSLEQKVDNGVYYRDGIFYLNMPGLNIRENSLSMKINIPGKHNIQNILFSMITSFICGISPQTIIETVSGFKGVEHRLEFVRELDGVKYINDSKSTNVDSTYVALESFEEPIVLIMGGRDKGAPYTPLAGLVKKKVKSLLLIGESTDKILKDLKGTTDMVVCVSMEKALLEAKKKSVSGDIVLLSPGCSSFDQFSDFEHRGKYFKELVNKLGFAN